MYTLIKYYDGVQIKFGGGVRGTRSKHGREEKRIKHFIWKS
jgi:hypothetical protein